MIQQAEYPKKKTILAKVCIIFFAILILLTFLSRTIAAMLLPQVTPYEITNGRIAYTYDCTGSVKYRDTYPVALLSRLMVTEILVEEMQTVTAGTPLFRVDVEEMKLECRTKELAIDKLKKEQFITQDLQAANALREEIAIEEAYLARLKEAYPEAGWVLAPDDGIVMEIAVDALSWIEPGETAMKVVDDHGARRVCFSTPFEIGNHYFVGDDVTVTYHTVVKDQETKRESVKNADIKVAIAQKTYDTATNEWRFELDFEPESQEIFDDRIQVRMIKSSANYPMVVPLSCLTITQQGSADVFWIDERPSLFGPETFIKKVSVDIVEMNSTYAAISTSSFYEGAKLVRYSTGALEHGKAVGLRDANE